MAVGDNFVISDVQVLIFLLHLMLLAWAGWKDSDATSGDYWVMRCLSRYAAPDNIRLLLSLLRLFGANLRAIIMTLLGSSSSEFRCLPVFAVA
jgi:hypothetical protein